MSGSRRQAGQMVEAAQKMLPNLRIEILDKENELAGRMGGANYDYSSAKKEFGYEPKYSIEEGIRLTMEYYRNRQ
jgi:nucleoside-diphosphate-sugar epimerase